MEGVKRDVGHGQVWRIKKQNRETIATKIMKSGSSEDASDSQAAATGQADRAAGGTRTPTVLADQRILSP